MSLMASMRASKVRAAGFRKWALSFENASLDPKSTKFAHRDRLEKFAG